MSYQTTRQIHFLCTWWAVYHWLPVPVTNQWTYSPEYEIMGIKKLATHRRTCLSKFIQYFKVRIQICHLNYPIIGDNALNFIYDVFPWTESFEWWRSVGIWWGFCSHDHYWDELSVWFNGTNNLSDLNSCQIYFPFWHILRRITCVLVVIVSSLARGFFIYVRWKSR